MMTQADDYFRIRLISRLISGTSRVLQKLIKYFNDPTVSTFVVLPSSGILPISFILGLNDPESAKLAFESSL